MRSIFWRRETAIARGRAAQDVLELEARAPGARLAGIGGRATRGGRPPMSARRVELVQGGSGSARAEPRLEVLLVRELAPGAGAGAAGRSRATSSSNGVAVSRSTWRPSAAMGATARQAGSPAWPGGRRSRCASSTTSEVDARLHRLLREARARDQRLQRDDGPAVHVEGVEVGTEVARHVGQPRLVEEDEDLVVLPPQLAQPLHGQASRAPRSGSARRAPCARAG